MINPKQFSEFVADATSDPDAIAARLTGPRAVNLVHGITGATSEMGELSDLLKKYMMGRDLDPLDIVDEVGDILHYLTMTLNAVGATPDQAMELNVIKLTTRWANGKDKVLERAAMLKAYEQMKVT